MHFPPIYIADYDCLSPAGHGVTVLLESLFASRTQLHHPTFPQGLLPDEIHDLLSIMSSEKSLKDQDKTSRMGLFLARRMQARFSTAKESSGVIVGSSRGPTETLEKSWKCFEEGQRLSPVTSPTTTASSLPACLARELAFEGPSFSLSAACSTGLYALIQGVSSIISHLCESVLVGGVEASNTEFTFEMLRAAKVLNSKVVDDFPCRPGHPDRSGMVLGEGAALLRLERHRGESQFEIIGWGTATESGTLTGISDEGKALQLAINRALAIADIDSSAIDIIVGHGAGTMKGDNAELEAYRKMFLEMPALIWHKWCTGHMLGASAALSVMLACEHLKSGKLPPHPYFPQGHPMRLPIEMKSPKIALITSMGFGGSACALLVKNLL